MTKPPKSIFESPLSENQLRKDAKQLQQHLLGTEDQTHAKSSDKPLKLAHIYVEPSHHKQAKINASIREMTLRDYIGWLITQDKPEV
ncbi:MAG: hypothetical protein MI974_12885 [Chitinophagales bacterium]|nr:hypothetical protein [Chitinophagales bacterium]